MSTVFKKLKTVDMSIKDSVFGYIRSMQTELRICNIPALISYIALNYYYHNEYFAKFGEQVKLANNNMTVTKMKQSSDKDYYENTTYGNTWIDSNIEQIATWTLKMPTSDFCLAMISKDDKIDGWLSEHDAPYYGLDLEEGEDANECNDGEHANECEFEFPRDLTHLSDLIGVEISVILDTMKQTIVFKVNKSSEIVAKYSKIQIGDKIKYKLGINLFNIEDSVSLIDFDLRLL